MTGRLLRQKWITRADLRSNPERRYVFGDNLARVGLGGQAREMRGEPNAIGVPTKVSPRQFMTDVTPGALIAIDEAFHEVRTALLAGHDVVVPTDGLGTGLAELPTRAPKVAWCIDDHLRRLEREFGGVTAPEGLG